MHFNDINATFIVSNTIVSDLLHAKLCWTLYNIKIIQFRICTCYSFVVEVETSLVMIQRPLRSYCPASSSNETGNTVLNFQLLIYLYKSIKHCSPRYVTFNTNRWSYYIIKLKKMRCMFVFLIHPCIITNYLYTWHYKYFSLINDVLIFQLI